MPQSDGQTALATLSEPGRAEAHRRWLVLRPHLEDGVPLTRVAAQSKADTSTQAIRKTLEMITPATIVSTLLLLSAVLLVSGVHDGLYVLIVPVLAALTGGVASAWLFLTKITE